MPELKNISLDRWDHPEFREHDLIVDVLRLDKIHPEISGNKWFKLKYYLERAKQENKQQLISFGGAYSNHLLALAAAARIYGFSSVGLIRGNEPLRLSHTLLAAKDYGMELRFLSRTEYNRQKQIMVPTEPCELNLRDGFENELAMRSEYKTDALFIPEGGAGMAGVRGAEEILSASGRIPDYTHICSAVGTGTTLAGIINGTGSHVKKIGLSVLKGSRDLEPMNRSWIKDPGALENVRIIHDGHYGGYAKKSKPLIDFMNEVYRVSGIPTDFVYTAKLFHSIVRMTAEKAFDAGSRILVLHTGGLQGNRSLAPGQLEF